jgi:hypothetical protein
MRLRLQQFFDSVGCLAQGIEALLKSRDPVLRLCTLPPEVIEHLFEMITVHAAPSLGCGHRVFRQVFSMSQPTVHPHRVQVG